MKTYADIAGSGSPPSKTVIAGDREKKITGLKAELKKAQTEDYVYQYKCLVECDEDQLSPDALEVRQILLRDRAELEKIQVKIETIAKALEHKRIKTAYRLITQILK